MPHGPSTKPGSVRRPRVRLLLARLAGVTALATAAGLAPVGPAAATIPHHAAHLAKPRTPHAAPAIIPGPMVDHGGPVQTAPRVYVDFWGWGSDPSGEQAYLSSFLASIGGTPWLATVNQYRADSPANLLAGTWSDPAAVPSTPSDAQVQAEAANAAAYFGTGTSADVEIVVATPTGHSTSGFGTDYCAYHGTVSSMPNVTYTDLPYMTDAGTACGENAVNPGPAGILDGVSIIEGQELAGTLTDPLANAWFDSGGNEIGDKCAWSKTIDVTTSAGTFAVQPLWSNATNSCTLATDVAFHVVPTVINWIYHEQHYADGSWSTLDFQTHATGTPMASGSSTDGAGNLHVVLAIKSSIYYEIRYADGTWSALTYQTSAPGAISSISAAYDRAGDLLDVVATVGSSIYYEQRHANGSWSALIHQTDARAAIRTSSSSTDGTGNLHVVLAAGTAIYHEIRYANGTWSPLAYQTSALTPVTSISAAYDRSINALNVIATLGSSIYYEQRHANGTWSTLAYQSNAPATISASGSSTDDAGNLQVVVTAGVSIYNETRSPSGTWTALTYQTHTVGLIGSISGAIG